MTIDRDKAAQIAVHYKAVADGMNPEFESAFDGWGAAGSGPSMNSDMRRFRLVDPKPKVVDLSNLEGTMIPCRFGKPNASAHGFLYRIHEGMNICKPYEDHSGIRWAHCRPVLNSPVHTREESYGLMGVVTVSWRSPTSVGMVVEYSQLAEGWEWP